MDETSRPGFAEFLTYVLIHLLSVIDVLDLADSRQLLRHVRAQAAWPAAAMLAGLRLFFTLILLQQVFASVRRVGPRRDDHRLPGPHEPIHDKAGTRSAVRGGRDRSAAGVPEA